MVTRYMEPSILHLFCFGNVALGSAQNSLLDFFLRSSSKTKDTPTPSPVTGLFYDSGITRKSWLLPFVRVQNVFGTLNAGER